jgi:hypothetical protein
MHEGGAFNPISMHEGGAASEDGRGVSQVAGKCTHLTSKSRSCVKAAVSAGVLSLLK